MASRMHVAVLGARGHTGRFVVRTLLERGVQPIEVARIGGDGSAASDRSVDFADPASLDRALADADAVLNCAGPFIDTAEPAARAALRVGIPYLDITAEQWTANHLFETLHAPAQERGVTVVPAMAFYGGLADLMVSALCPAGGFIDTVEVATALDSWHPTRGTRLTGDRNTYGRLVVSGGALVPVPTPRPARDWRFPAPFGLEPVTCAPMSEMVLLSRHLRIGSAISYLNDKSLADLSDAATPAPVPADHRGRSAQRFVTEVRVTAAGRSRRAVASGFDIYAATAPILVAGCRELLESRAGRPGVHAPGALFDARALLAGLAPDIVVEFAEVEEDVSRDRAR